MTTEGSFIQPAIPRFDGHYDHWSMLMENFLRSKEFWGLVESGYIEPASESVQTDAQRKKNDEMKLKDLKVKNYLFQAIDRTVLDTILKKDTAKDIWDAMKKKFEGNARVKRSHLQALHREFETLEMRFDEGVTEYFSRVMTVANKMRIYGEDMQDVKVVEKILRSLTEKFNYVVCSIEESKDIDALTVDELQSSLIVHEQKFQKRNGEKQALKVTSEGGRGCGRGTHKGRGRGKGRADFNKATVECYRCHQLGHFRYECPSGNKEANYAELDEEEEMLLMSYVELYKARREDAWFLDSGCSNHMCGDRTMFNELDEKFRHSVKLGNNTKMDVMGKGSVKLLLNESIMLLLRDVQDISSKEGFDNSNQHECQSDVYLAASVSTPSLKYNLISAFTQELKTCFIFGIRDICGPITPTSNSNKRYILLFIDDYSRKAWVYFLVEKSEALNSFKCFKTMVEKETGLFVKCFRTDRGGEFNSNEFNDFCKQSGIKRQLTTAYTPQQNSVAERKNRTVMNMVRSMLFDKNIPKTFWPEAVNWTIYVLNRCPTLVVTDVTPEECLLNSNLPVVRQPSSLLYYPSLIKIDPTSAHVHVPEERRTKLDNRSITCVLLGVSEESKGYRLFDPVAKRVVVSRDVIFEEEKQWDWDVSYEEQIVVDLEWGDGDGENEEGVSENGNRENTDGEVGETRDTGVKEEEDGSSEGLFEDEVHMALVESTDPLYFEEAVKSANWRLAMNSEIKSIEKNQTWTLTELPAGAKRIGVKWVYKTKYNEHGKIDKYKARLVVKGFSRMASSSSQNKPETINLNDTPSVMPEVWRPYFLSINGPVSVTDSVILNGETATAVAAGLCTPEDAKILAGRTDPQIINESLALTIQCTATVSNMGRRLHVRNMEVKALRSQVTILQRLLKESKKKVGEVKEENKRLKALVDSYADDLVIRSTEQSKTTNKLQKQYEKLLAEVKELTSRSIPK
uniref:Integrase catalytic domain-containing protein n=5 Tax=Fagus sylvatica TaxID=28930 RepID=A0A2N9G6A8_FAGSY